MSNNNSLCCDVCNKTHFETPIIEKPLRVARKAKVISLSHNNQDGRKVDNICLTCLQKEINDLTKKL